MTRLGRGTCVPGAAGWRASAVATAIVRWAAVLAVVACADRATAPDAGRGPSPGPSLALHCAVAVHSATVRCAPADTSSGHAAADAAPTRDLTLGGQNLYVTLASSNVSYSGDVFSFDATVQNLIPQALGTTDGTTLDPNGVRVFFQSAPTTTGGTGTVDFISPVDASSLVDGYATFTASNQPYYQYNQMLAQNATSSAKIWKLHVPATVTSFAFVVYVSAAVEYPNGWIDVTPASDTVGPGNQVTLTGTVRDVVGRAVTGHTLTWSSTNTGVATVNASTGVVSTIAPGTTTINVSDGTVSGSTPFVTRNSVPALVTHAFNYPGNVAVTVDSAHGFMAGMTDADASQNHTLITPSPGSHTLGSGAVLVVNANGSFTYTPAAGETATDSVPYTVSDGIDSASASYAKLSLSGGMHWYVDNTASSSGANGTQAHPFTSLASVSGTAANDTIFVMAGSGATAGPVTLLAGQSLIGQAAVASNLVVTVNSASVTLLATGGTPDISRSTAGAAVTLGSGNTVKGVKITASSGDAVAGTSFGTLTLASDSLEASGGAALTLTTGTVAGGSTLLFAKSTGGSYGLNLNGVAGSLTITRDSVFDATSADVRIVNGTVSLTTSAGGISQTTATGRPVDIESNTGGTVALAENVTGTTSGLQPVLFQSNSGGTFTLSGAITLSTGGNGAITATSNTGATVNVTGGALAITTTSGTALAASGGGTISVTGAGNTITTTTGTAVSVVSTTIGAGGLIFRSINVSGATHAIVLSGTGSGGGLAVTGTTGTCASSSDSCTGGTIQNTTADGVQLISTANTSLSRMKFINANGTGTATAGVCDTTANSGCHAVIAMTSVTGPTFSNLYMDGSSQVGINGITVSGLTLSNSIVKNMGNEGGEDALAFTDLTGNSSFSGDSIIDGKSDLLQIWNSAGGGHVAITSTVFRFGSARTHGGGDYARHAINLASNVSSGTGVTLAVTHSTFVDIPQESFYEASSTGSAQDSLTFYRDSVVSTAASKLGDILIEGGASHTILATVTASVFSGANGFGIVAVNITSPNAVKIKLQNDSVYANAFVSPGNVFVFQVEATSPSLTALVDNNYATNYLGDPVEAATFAGGSSQTMNVAVTNNYFHSTAYTGSPGNIGGPNFYRYHASDNVCIAFKGNDIVTSSSGEDVYFEGNFGGEGTTINVETPGFTGALVETDLISGSSVSANSLRDNSGTLVNSSNATTWVLLDGATHYNGTCPRP